MSGGAAAIAEAQHRSGGRGSMPLAGNFSSHTSARPPNRGSQAFRGTNPLTPIPSRAGTVAFACGYRSGGPGHYKLLRWHEIADGGHGVILPIWAPQPGWEMDVDHCQPTRENVSSPRIPCAKPSRRMGRSVSRTGSKSAECRDSGFKHVGAPNAYLLCAFFRPPAGRGLRCRLRENIKTAYASGRTARRRPFPFSTDAL